MKKDADSMRVRSNKHRIDKGNAHQTASKQSSNDDSKPHKQKRESVQYLVLEEAMREYGRGHHH